MKKLLAIPLTFILLQSQGFSMCSDFPSLTPGKKVQNVNGLIVNGQAQQPNPDSPSIGEDIVYEGSGCPAGKICVETLFNIRGAAATIHGQVIVIDKSTGDVSDLCSVNLIASSGSSSASGNSGCSMNLYNPARIEPACNGIASLNRPAVTALCRGQEPTRELFFEEERASRQSFIESLENRPNRQIPERQRKRQIRDLKKELRRLSISNFTAPTISSQLDMYSFTPMGRGISDEDGSPFSGVYKRFSSGSKSRLIANFNEGTSTEEGQYIQRDSYVHEVCNHAGQSDQRNNCPRFAENSSGAATVNHIGELVARTRRALSCEQTAVDEQTYQRVGRLLSGSALSGRECEVRYDERAKSITVPGREFPININSFGPGRGRCSEVTRQRNIEKFSCSTSDSSGSDYAFEFELQDGEMTSFSYRPKIINSRNGSRGSCLVRAPRAENESEGNSPAPNSGSSDNR